MHRFQTVISILCVRLLIAPAFAQQAHQIGEPGGTFAWITGRYRMQQVPPIDLANSGRLELLLRAGRLYLSLQDAIALALENNLDIEIQRYGPQIADAQVLRARAGAFAQGVSPSVTAGPTRAQPGGVAQSGVSGNPSTQASAASSTGVHTWLSRRLVEVPVTEPRIRPNGAATLILTPISATRTVPRFIGAFCGRTGAGPIHNRPTGWTTCPTSCGHEGG